MTELSRTEPVPACSMNGLGLAGTAAGSRQGSSVQSHLMPSLASSFSFLFLVKSEHEHPREALPIGPPGMAQSLTDSFV